eukprot:403369881
MLPFEKQTHFHPDFELEDSCSRPSRVARKESFQHDFSSEHDDTRNQLVASTSMKSRNMTNSRESYPVQNSYLKSKQDSLIKRSNQFYDENFSRAQLPESNDQRSTKINRNFSGDQNIEQKQSEKKVMFSDSNYFKLFDTRDAGELLSHAPVVLITEDTFTMTIELHDKYQKERVYREICQVLEGKGESFTYLKRKVILEAREHMIEYALRLESTIREELQDSIGLKHDYVRSVVKFMLVKDIPRYGRKGIDQNAIKDVDDFENCLLKTQLERIVPAVQIVLTNFNDETSHFGFQKQLAIRVRPVNQSTESFNHHSRIHKEFKTSFQKPEQRQPFREFTNRMNNSTFDSNVPSKPRFNEPNIKMRYNDDSFIPNPRNNFKQPENYHFTQQQFTPKNQEKQKYINQTSSQLCNWKAPENLRDKNSWNQIQINHHQKPKGIYNTEFARRKPDVYDNSLDYENPRSHYDSQRDAARNPQANYNSQNFKDSGNPKRNFNSDNSTQHFGKVEGLREIGTSVAPLKTQGMKFNKGFERNQTRVMPTRNQNHFQPSKFDLESQFDLKSLQSSSHFTYEEDDEFVVKKKQPSNINRDFLNCGDDQKYENFQGRNKMMKDGADYEYEFETKPLNSKISRF